MKQKTTFIILFLFTHLFISAQTENIPDSLYQNPNHNLSISKTGISNIVWERIAIPEGKELMSFEITPENELYIGCRFGGVYKYSLNTWELIGLNNLSVSEFETNDDDNLLIVSNDLYCWNGNAIQFVSAVYTNPLKNLFGSLFGAYGTNAVRSEDGGVHWDTVCHLSSAEMIADFTATNTDSIFMGTTNWVGEGGGVYLSIDGGDNWAPFGLSQHFIAALAVDNYNQVYAGNNGHYVTGQGGLYRYNKNTAVWDTLFYYPYITSIVFNTVNHIFLGFNTSGMADWGGVMHSEDSGDTWIVDTMGMGNIMVNELQIDNNGFLYALTGYTTKKLYRTTLPVSIKKIASGCNNSSTCFPNPADEYVNITIGKGKNNTHNLYIVLYNIEGKTIFKKRISKSEMEKGVVHLNTKHLRKGCYVYNIYGHNYKISNELIKR